MKMTQTRRPCNRRRPRRRPWQDLVWHKSETGSRLLLRGDWPTKRQPDGQTHQGRQIRFAAIASSPSFPN
jgi:hypothetical protein